MATWLDAINIDLKGWQPASHRRIVGGALAPVLDSLRLARQLGLWLEVSTLIVPGLTDDPCDLANIAHFITNELGPDTPWHLLHFYPHYQMMDKTVTSQTQIQQAVEIGQRAGLSHIYTKELAQGQMLNTVCPRCQSVLIQRKSYGLIQNDLVHGQCRQCGYPIQGIELDNSGLDQKEMR